MAFKILKRFERSEAIELLERLERTGLVMHGAPVLSVAKGRKAVERLEPGLWRARGWHRFRL